MGASLAACAPMGVVNMPATRGKWSRGRVGQPPGGRPMPLRTSGGIVTERSPEDVLGMVDSEGVEIVDLRFCDLPGLMQHFSVPAHQLTDAAFEEGYGFDGSSIRGFQE